MDWTITFLECGLYVLLACGALVAVLLPLYLLGVLLWGVSTLAAGCYGVARELIGLLRTWFTSDAKLLRE